MKILILTAEYPNSKSSFDTPVVHFYAKEWVKMGHAVRVIHYRSVFPIFFYTIAKIFKFFIKRIFKTDFIPLEKLHVAIRFQLDGVDITTEPIFKLIPHIRFSKSVIKRKAKQIIDENNNLDFQPDVIISHFLNPQLPLIAELKKYYPDVKSSLVLHENPQVISGLFGSSSQDLLNNFDYIGFRFEAMRNIFYSLFGKDFTTFICPSGIPENYILSETPTTKFKREVISISFVGMLIPLKNIDILVEAVNLAFPDRNFNLEIIGEGMLKEKISQKISELKLEGCVKMLGKLSRDEVQNKMIKNDIFVMVSKPEAFGLVYLEAMAKGCLTIGTKEQGIDGVIINDENGFLCEARSVESLKNVLLKIQIMTYEEKIQMSNNAMSTARQMTDEKVAIEYLKKIQLS